MEKEILELINGCDNCSFKKEYKKLEKLYQEEQEEKNRIFEGNIKLSDSNKWLKKDLKILSKFIDTYFNDDSLSDEVKIIINANKEEENEKKL